MNSFLKLLVVVALLWPSSMVFSQTTYTENFDVAANWSGTAPSTYGNKTYFRSGSPATFAATNSIRQAVGALQDGFPGTRGGSTHSWRQQDAANNWTATIATGGVGTFSVWVRRWDDTPDPIYVCEYSTNNGGSWTTVQTINNAWLGSSDWKQVSGTINTSNAAGTADDIIIRIIRTSGERIMIDDFSMTTYPLVTTCTAPTTQASNLTFDNIGSNAIDVNWTNGNGDGRVVLINTSNSFTTPASGSNPTANTAYAGSGEQVVYNGTGNGPVSISGLDPATEYWFQVYEFCNPDRIYQTAVGTNNPNSEETLPLASETITTTAAAFGPFCQGIDNNISIAYTTTGTFTGTFTAQLSNASGSFASPTNIGTGASPIAATIPSSVVAGSGYRVRVINDNPATLGTNNGSNIIIETVTVNLGADTSYCANVTFSQTLNAGNTGSSFLWNGGSSSQTLNITTAGTYSVIVTSVNGCEGTDQIVVTENQAPVVDLGADESFCADENVSVTLEAGNPGSTYLWSNGLVSQDITAQAFGTFWVAVTGANGCVGTDTMKINSLALPVINLGNDTSYCEGTNFSLVLDAGNPGSFYLWEDNSEEQTLNVTGAGFYAVIVEDLNGCLEYAEITITENPLPIVNLGTDTSYCAGTAFNILLDAGNPGSTYAWNGGGLTSQFFSATQAGTYSVVVTDANGCVGTHARIITENVLPVVNLGNDTSYCAGSSFSLTLDAGNAGSTFNWNSGAASTQTFTATGDGTYTVAVTDANGCVGTDSKIITEDALPVINLGNDISTAGASQVLDAGAGFTSYTWTPGNQTTQQITVTQNGTYGVTVTNADGCSASDQIQVWFTASIAEFNAAKFALQMYPNPALEQLNLSLDYNGPLTVDIIGIDGRNVWSKNIMNQANEAVQIDLGTFTSGVYIIRLSGADIQISKQFIIR
jgi:hypothetical protein